MLSYTQKIGSQVENTLTIALILRAFCGYPVDKSPPSLWIKMWKIKQLSLLPNLEPQVLAKLNFRSMSESEKEI